MNDIIKYLHDTINGTIKVINDKYKDYNTNETFNNNPKRIKNNIDIITQTTYFFKDPIHIIDNIYLGSAFNAASFYKLKDIYNISIIINVTNEISNYYPEHFQYKKYNLLDINEDSIIEYLDDAYNFIELNKDKNILIHCFMGASRSASLLAYYIMKKYNQTLDEVIDFISEKREIVNINCTFAQELKDSIIIQKN
jgi:protein-tyrosine phosphatase